DKDTFYFRYVYDTSSNISPRPVPTFVLNLQAIDHFVALSHTHVFSGASLNEFRTAYNRTPREQTSYPVKPIDPSLSFVPGTGMGTISYSAQAQIGGQGTLSQLGSHSGTPAAFTQNIFEESDTFSTVRGAHSFKFGADLQRVQHNYLSLPDGESGLYTFGGLTQLLAGTPITFVDSNFPGVPGLGANILGNRQILFGTFAQDDFRARPNLTINIGLRYEFYTSPTEINGRSVG